MKMQWHRTSAKPLSIYCGQWSMSFPPSHSPFSYHITLTKHSKPAMYLVDERPYEYQVIWRRNHQNYQLSGKAFAEYDNTLETLGIDIFKTCMYIANKDLDFIPELLEDFQEFCKWDSVDMIMNIPESKEIVNANI